MRHKKLKIGIISAAAALSMSAVSGVHSNAAWVQDSQGWRYDNNSNEDYSIGWEKIQGSWYYFNQNGVMHTGWLELNGDWYYFNGVGVMQTGWFRDNQKWYHSDSEGKRTEESKGSGSSIVLGNTGYEDREYIIYLDNGNREVMTGHFVESMEEDAFELLNAYRKEFGLNSLKKSQILDKSAEIRGYESSHLFKHTRPDGTSVLDMEEVYGENIAYGYSTAEALMDAWISSPSHNENMLKPNYNTVSIKVFAKQNFYTEGVYYTYHAVQIFGR